MTSPSERRRRIRNRTVAGSLAAFATVWAVIFGQLVSGRDPALGETTTQTQTQTTAQTPSYQSVPQQTTQQLDPVTTQQS